ncbi:MAG TPA: hypothetical protein VGK58_20960, partial [Lacipirellulaceae bacterium]
VYEPFDYPAGTVLAGTAATGLNLAGNYETTSTFPDQFQLTARSPGLNYGNLIGAPAPLGNSLTEPSGTTLGDAKVSVDSDVLVAPGQSIYWSALFTLNSATNGNRFANITFTDDDNGDLLQFGEGIGVRSVRIAAHTSSTGQLITAGTDPSFADGDTLLLIGRYINSAVPDGDRLDLIGYDTADPDVLPLSFEPTDPNAEFAYELENLDIDFEKITSITFTIRGDDNNFIDELRIGSSYSAIIPEPAAATLFVIAASLAGAVGLCRSHFRSMNARRVTAGLDGGL